MGKMQYSNLWQILTELLLDHNLIFCPYLASEDADTLDVIFRDQEEQLACMATSVEM
jgi:hypothetical protein